jgi:hypothetical protein
VSDTDRCIGTGLRDEPGFLCGLGGIKGLSGPFGLRVTPLVWTRQE